MMYEAALGCGMAVGPLVGGVLGSGSWRYPFFGVAFLMFCGFIALAVLLPETEKPKRKVGLWEGVKALSNHKLRSVGLIALLYNFGFFTLLAYAPFLLIGYSGVCFWLLLRFSLHRLLSGSLRLIGQF